MSVYFNGLILGLSLIIALGPQNIFLIRQGVQRNHALLSATICFICDMILIAASVTGLHELFIMHPTLQLWMLLAGGCFLLFYAQKTLQSVFKTTINTDEEQLEPKKRFQIILLAMGFSLLNPHAIIDSLVIIGGGSSQYPDQRLFFLMGVITSSLLWFSSLTFTARFFSEVLARNAVWKGIELVSGSLMLSIGLKLMYEGTKLVWY